MSLPLAEPILGLLSMEEALNGLQRPIEGPMNDSLSLPSSSSSLFISNQTDSGVSTMESLNGRDSNLAGILMNHNNNLHNNNCLPEEMDVVRLLKLKSVDREEQHSNSSSLESLDSTNNHQGSQEPYEEEEEEEGGGSGSTSCSEDSFEMSSTCSIRTSPETSPQRGWGASAYARTSRETTCDSFISMRSDSVCSSRTLNDSDVDRGREEMLINVPPPPSSISMDSFMINYNNHNNNTCNISTIRESIDMELNSLDTGLPTLDFDRLEKQLNIAAKERQDHERKLLGEQVRRRLALQVDAHSGPSPPVNTRPYRSNLALRLQTAMNLQICYMNELAESGTESESDDDDEGIMVSKSKSAPNLKVSAHQNKDKTEDIQLRERAKQDEKLTPVERRQVLIVETKKVQCKAKQEAELALEQHRRLQSRASGIQRQSRQYLSKMTIEDIRKIKDQMEEAIDKKNMELVHLLISRDGLHMEHDSLLVDIDDFTQHEAETSALLFSRLLSMQDGDITPAGPAPSPIGPTYNGRDGVPPTPTPTPTSPTKAFVSALPKSFPRFSLFRR